MVFEASSVVFKILYILLLFLERPSCLWSRFGYHKTRVPL